MNFSYLRREPGFYRRVFTLALPVVLQNLITTSLGFMDTFMVGLVGQEQMSAVTVANVPIYIIQLIVFGLQSGSRVLISQFWGRGDRESINRVMGIGFFVAGGISTLCALTMGLFPRQCPSGGVGHLLHPHRGLLLYSQLPLLHLHRYAAEH